MEGRVPGMEGRVTGESGMEGRVTGESGMEGRVTEGRVGWKGE